MARSAIWQAAETFGAIPSHSLTAKVTHCVTATLGTEKTYRASKLGVPVVWQGWFWESINLWKRQDEKIWLAIPEKSNGNTPGPSTPTTPALPTLPLADDSETGDKVQEEEQEEDKGAETFEEDEGLGDGWDDDAQAEFDAFMDGSSDFGSDAGRYVPKLLVRSRLTGSERTDMSREGTPGTPSKKRVRYADEEQLPLETFKDPSPNRFVLYFYA
jgi:RNA polymerase II subunit A-like phosphatase